MTELFHMAANIEAATPISAGTGSWFPGKQVLAGLLPGILDKFVLPAIALMVKDIQARIAGLPFTLSYDEAGMKAYILAKFAESQ